MGVGQVVPKRIQADLGGHHAVLFARRLICYAVRVVVPPGRAEDAGQGQVHPVCAILKHTNNSPDQIEGEIKFAYSSVFIRCIFVQKETATTTEDDDETNFLSPVFCPNSPTKLVPTFRFGIQKILISGRLTCFYILTLNIGFEKLLLKCIIYFLDIHSKFSSKKNRVVVFSLIVLCQTVASNRTVQTNQTVAFPFGICIFYILLEKCQWYRGSQLSLGRMQPKNELGKYRRLDKFFAVRGCLAITFVAVTLPSNLNSSS